MTTLSWFYFVLPCFLPQVLLLWMLQTSSCPQPPSLNMLIGCLVPQTQAGDYQTKSSSSPCSPCLSPHCTTHPSTANCPTATKSTKRFALLTSLLGKNGSFLSANRLFNIGSFEYERKSATVLESSVFLLIQVGHYSSIQGSFIVIMQQRCTTKCSLQHKKNVTNKSPQKTGAHFVFLSNVSSLNSCSHIGTVIVNHPTKDWQLCHLLLLIILLQYKGTL